MQTHLGVDSSLSSLTLLLLVGKEHLPQREIYTLH